MILGDKDIEKALNDKTIQIIPEQKLAEQLGSASLDLRLGN